MLLSDMIINEFKIFIDDYSATLNVIHETNIYNIIEYNLSTIKIIVSVDEMDDYFSIKIYKIDNEKQYIQNLFEVFKKPEIEISFIDEVNDLFDKSKCPFNRKKSLLLIIGLYRKLLINHLEIN
ncbi:MAG: hypothetical protein ACYCYI_05590 [Saccharofermentanales bacterium]